MKIILLLEHFCMAEKSACFAKAWRKPLFYATTSKYIMSCKKYMFSALLPTILISLSSIIAYICFKDCRTTISMFYCVQLLASYLDIGIASYCFKNKYLYYCEEAQKRSCISY